VKREEYEQLLDKLNNYIDNDDVDSSVSPTLGSGGAKTSPDLPFIASDMDLSHMNRGELLLVHALLHQFYSRGGIKGLKKRDIENLHAKVAEKIDHVDFDKLDKK